MGVAAEPLRVGQFSGYYGDRVDTFPELIDSDVQVLTGDYLAELTMLVLKKNQMRGGDGYASGFIPQVEGWLQAFADRGIKVVTNAGGLDPVGCARALRAVCVEAGVSLAVAAITGDDVLDLVPTLADQGESFKNLDDGSSLDLAQVQLLTANAYLGAWPIVEALKAGADIIICPRVTDASLVMGSAAWHFGWSATDFDRLAGALWAGHVTECGGQVTGGNFSLFAEYGDLGLPGMPIAEIYANGDVIVSKAVGTGGIVNADTVRAQLLYETGGAEYQNPDVVADLSSIRVEDLGGDRVSVTGARGFAPTPYAKLSLGYEGGYRNSVTVGLTGANAESKLSWLKRAVARAVGDPDTFDQFRISVIGPKSPSEGTFEEATAWAVFTARDRDRRRVGRAGFSDPITQLGTSNIPGFYLSTPPQKERMVGVQWPCLIEKRHLAPTVVLPDGERIVVKWPQASLEGRAFQPAEGTKWTGSALPAAKGEPMERLLLGSLFGTRSGDKAGMANLGIWARTEEQFQWLRTFMTTDQLRIFLPDVTDLRIDRHVLSNLLALNFQVYGYLEEGVASCTRVDPQAKGLGEFVGSRLVDVPKRLLEGQ